MLQNAYFLAKIGADTAENEQHFAEILPIGRRVADRCRSEEGLRRLPAGGGALPGGGRLRRLPGGARRRQQRVPREGGRAR